MIRTPVSTKRTNRVDFFSLLHTKPQLIYEYILGSHIFDKASLGYKFELKKKIIKKIAIKVYIIHLLCIVKTGNNQFFMF